MGVSASVFHEHTSGRTPNKDTTDSLVYTSESTCLVEALRGLQTCLYRVYWVEQKIDGCSSNAACLERAWVETR